MGACSPWEGWAESHSVARERPFSGLVRELKKQEQGSQGFDGDSGLLIQQIFIRPLL